MITLDIHTANQASPVDLRVYIDNLANNDDRSFIAPIPFSQPLNLSPGKYQLTISGMNNNGGTTTATLSGTFKTGPIPASTQTQSGTIVSIVFFFEV